MVTNQSGIARQLYGWTEFARVEREIALRLALAGAQLDAVAACPFHPRFSPEFGTAESHWRKPGPGLVLAAARMLNVDIATSWLVGDRASDIESARNAGLAGAIQLISEAASPEGIVKKAVTSDGFQVSLAATLSETLEILKGVGLLSERM